MVARLSVLAPLLALAVQPAVAQAPKATIAVPRVVLDVDGRVSTPAPEGVPAAVRITVDASTVGEAPIVAPSGWPVWLSVRDADAAAVDPSTWPQRLRAAIAAVPRVAAIELQADAADPRRTAFLIKLVAAEVRSLSPSIAIVLAGPAAHGAARDALVTADVAPSIDAYSLSEGVPPGPVWTWVNDHDPGATLVQLFAYLSEGLGFGASLAGAELQRLGTPVATRVYRVPAARVDEATRVLGRLKDVYAGDVVPVEAASGSLRLHRGTVDVTDTMRWRLLYNVATLGTYLVLDTGGPERLGVSVVVPSAGTVVVRDPAGGRDRAAQDTTRDDSAQRTSATVNVPAAGTWLIDFNRGAEAGFVQQEDVTAARTLSVDEILARHQARQAAERERSPRYVMNGRIQQYFRPSQTDAGFDIVTVNRFFVDRAEGTEWEEREFSVNGAKFGEPRPPFPLLQPEKVLTPPLSIELDARYRYRLEGSENVQGRPAWVVSFTPARSDQTLYRGTVWIDKVSYARLRQQAVQTGLTAPVTSNDETQDYATFTTADGGEVSLPSRIYNQQLILVAGRTLLVERRITFDGYEIAPGDFSAQRQEARGGAKTMYRDTNVGVRYLVKEGNERVVSDIATTRAKALALGLTIDPGFDFPLPIGGINYLNFRFRGRPDTQVAILFAGVLAAGNIQRPKAIANRIDASLDFFLMAPPSSDRLFLPGGEREDQRLLTWPLSTGLNLGWQATSYQRISGLYQFKFDGYVRDSTTSAEYVTPSTTVTNGVGTQYEYRRSGYSVIGNATWFRRASWRPWGVPETLLRTSPSYARYSLAGTKVFYLGPLSKIVLNGAWYGGDRLDRFSQYQFGLFDETKIHGVPSAGVRYGELAMARGQYSFNLFEQYRMDVFLDRAWGRVRGNPRFATVDVPWEPLTGVGVAFNVRIPGRTAILRGEVGKSFLPRRYDGLGSTTVQIMLLKP
ncbi:MAG TPA: hypothetical protein VMF13_17805, partial [Luteitalea sp.]|nr:hypothetical protein [Luteitalea sp.]